MRTGYPYLLRGELGRCVVPSLVSSAVLCAVLSIGTVAQAGNFNKGPYLQNVSDDSITILWESSVRTEGKVILHSQPPRSFASVDDIPMHEVVIDGLSPGQRYRYTVISGGEEKSGEFATAPQAGTPFSFIVYGDSRSNASAHARVVERIRQEVPDFLLGTGDIVNVGSSEADWSKLFQIEGKLLQDAPMFPSLGNHDRQGRGRTASNYRKYFSLPENSPDPERYYAFTYGSARFLVLDSNAYSFALTDQSTWIEKQLQSARLDKSVEHIFVSMHHPPFSVSLHGGQSDLREAWTPLFEKYHVDAVFSGHDHAYSRAFKNGVHYFVSGGGGAPLYPRKKKSKALDVEATKYFERVNHHLRVQVVGNNVEVTAVRADGTIIESLSWGSLPKLDKSELFAKLSGPASLSPSGDALPIPAVGAGETQLHQGASQSQSHTSQPGQGKKGFGILGMLGGVLTLLAGGVGLWAWKQ